MALFGDFHFVSGAGWTLYWRISKLHGSGLEIWFADFQGKRVVWRGTQPFAIVPYHRPIADPQPPEFTYKDGINAQWAEWHLRRSNIMPPMPGPKALQMRRLIPTPWYLSPKSID